MKIQSTVIGLLSSALLAFSCGAAYADPDKDESGHGRWKGRHGGGEHKEEYWDGRCKVERKWEKGGEYKEERKCKGRSARAPVYKAYEAPAYAHPQPVVVVQQPPGIYIQPPAVVIRP